MKCHVGVDIGAVSLTAALLIDGGAPALPPHQFTPAGELAGAKLYLSSYRRTRGRPIETATKLLEEVVAAIGQDSIASLCFTGSAGRLLAEKLSSGNLNEFKAIALGLGGLGVEARTVFEMGGQSSKYLLLEAAQASGLSGDETDTGGTPVLPLYSIVDYATNGDCAAGTGSFIDQQAGRLRYAVEDVGKIALSVQRSAQVAGRCSVFAKSDMIHAQQKGYSPGEVLSGLCDAVARNFRMAVVRSHAVVPPVAFIGGLAANAAVVAALPKAFDLHDDQFVVPQAFAHVLAVGAARAGRESSQAARRPSQAGAPESEPDSGGVGGQIGRLRAASDTTHGQFPTAQPLAMDRVLLLRDHVEPYELPYGRKVDAYLGLDIGSVSTNVVLLDPDGNVIKDIYVRTQGRPIEVVAESLRDIAAELGDRVVIRGVGTTGSGRELIGELVGADTVNDEITAHKIGATFIGQKLLNGRVPDTIFEIGGQDSKFISLQDGVVVDFTMNEACAAGTGSFLEERAEELDIAIINEFAELALSSTAPIRLGERCTVFMERDVNDYLQRGASKADLVAGLAYSVVYNYINRVVRGRKIGDCVFFQGGTAFNDAVAAAFTAVLGKEIIVPPYNGVIGAIGSALLARDKMVAQQCGVRSAECEVKNDGADDDSEASHKDQAEDLVGVYVSAHARTRPAEDNPQSEIRNPKSSRFRGYDLTKVSYGLREFDCRGCSNRCLIQEFDVEGEKTYWGDKCSDRYRKRKKSTAKPVIDDLLALRERLLNDESHLPPAPDAARSIGIPRAMFGLDFLPFWRTFWRGCGFGVVVSEPTNRRTVAAGTACVVAEPCFPVIVAHGHVAELLEKGVDFIFLPNTVSAETRWPNTESYLCPWNQTLPFVVRRVPAFEKHAERFLSPCLLFRKGPRAVGKALRQLCARLGVKPAVVDGALAAAYRAQQEFRQALLSAGDKALDELDRAGQVGIVILGRPYNIHDVGANLSVARKLRDYYGVNCIPVDFLDTAGVDVRDVNANMYWDYGRRLIAAARLVGRRANLHIIYITNFKCGPDSFIRHFIRAASGKPFLSLQFDGHSNDAGMMTRCEAYLDSKGILRPWKKQASAEDAAVVSG